MKYINLIILSLLLLSCSEYEEPIIENNFTIGSIYCSDGSTIAPSNYVDSGKTAIGVIFWVNNEDESINESAFAVSLIDLSSTALISLNTDVSSVSEDEDEYNGASNTAAFLVYATTKEIEAPAIAETYSFAPDGVSGWYIPSSSQAKLISNNLKKVYNSFSYCNGEQFSQWYWTSTKDGTGDQTAIINALIIALNEGTISTSLKTNKLKTRPIISIR